MIGILVATVFIPTMLRPLAGNCETIEADGSTVAEVVNNLTQRYPELRERLLERGQLRGNISVAIDGEVSTLGMLDDVEEDAEVHFIPAISGGRQETDAVAVG